MGAVKLTRVESMAGRAGHRACTDAMPRIDPVSVDSPYAALLAPVPVRERVVHRLGSDDPLLGLRARRMPDHDRRRARLPRRASRPRARRRPPAWTAHHQPRPARLRRVRRLPPAMPRHRRVRRMAARLRRCPRPGRAGRRPRSLLRLDRRPRRRSRAVCRTPTARARQPDRSAGARWARTGFMSRLTLLYYRLARALPAAIGSRLLGNRLIVRFMSVLLARVERSRATAVDPRPARTRYFSRYADRDSRGRGLRGIHRHRRERVRTPRSPCRPC